MCLKSSSYTPAPTPPMVTDTVAARGEAETGGREAERRRRRMALSAADTNVTGAAGASALPAAGEKKTLLGQ